MAIAAALAAVLFVLVLPGWRLEAAPPEDLRRVYLRMLVANSPGVVEEAQRLLQQGQPFSQVARRLSSDVTAARGGYLGAMKLAQMNEVFRRHAQDLEPGSHSPPFSLGRETVILYRMPEGFRDQAIELSEEADAVMEEGRLEEAIAIYRRAIELNPEFIHGYFKLGVALGKAGRAREEIDTYLKAIEIEPEYHQAYYNLGAALQGLGEHRAAISAFQRALQVDPNRAYCYVNLSGAYQALGEYQQAIQAAQRAIDINPLLPVAHFNLGVAYGQRQPAEALKAFQMAATLDPGNPRFLHSQAIALAHLGRVEEARSILQDLLRRNPSMEAARSALQELDSPGRQAAPAAPAEAEKPAPVSAEALAEKARNALLEGDFESALNFYDQAVRINPASREFQFQRAWTLVALGKVLQGQGQWENAWKTWERALQLYADFVPALTAMAHASTVQGRFTLAEELLERARRLEPGNPEIAILASRLAYERRDLEESFQHLQAIDLASLQGPQQLKLLEQLLYLDLDEQALALFRSLRLPAPQMLEAVNHLVKFSLFEEAEKWLKANPSPYGQALLGKLYSEQLRFQEAEAVLSTLAAADPQAWSAHYFLGQVHLNAGRAVQAIESFKRALDLQPDNVNVLLLLGQAAAQAGQSAESKQWLRRGLELSPDSYQLHFEMGSLLLEEGNIQAAEEHLLKVLQSEPDHIRTHYLMGRLYQRKGQTEKAREYLQRFEELKKQLDEGRQRLLAQQNALKGRKLIP